MKLQTTTRALIADDDAQMRELLVHAIGALDIEVIEAGDALSALVMAHETVPDLVILDVSMPGGNGLSACEMLAYDPSTTNVPVIILTGKSDDATLFRCQRLRALYVCKGADAIDRVVSTVRRLACAGGVTSCANPDLFVG